MNTTLYCPDIECSSCIRVISKALEKKEGVEKYSVDNDTITITHNDSVKTHDLISLIEQKGFRAGLEPFSKRTFKERMRDFKDNRQKYSTEYTMLTYAALVFLSLTVVEVILFWGYFSASSELFTKYSWWFFYLTLSIVSIGAAMWHFQSYRGTITTMTGMMIGMTFGMQTGFLVGTIIGATNGMFVGSMSGMLSGTLVGWLNGRCCGIMGVMEGTMAGVMAGLMGAMTGVMLLVDHILWFMPFFMVLNLIVIFGLSYMLFEEFIENNKTISKKPVSFFTYFSLSFLALATLGFIMIYGPKTGLAGLG